MDPSAFLMNAPMFPPIQIHMQERFFRVAQNYPTDYAQFVLDVLAKMTRDAGAIDQAILQRAIGLASSYLVTDASTNPDGGIATWKTGFNRLADLVVVLHHRGELELDTFNEASKACSECWSVAATWRGMEDCRQGVKEVAGKLKKLLDEPNRRTYKDLLLPVVPSPRPPPTDLTPLRAHYLKKALVTLQIRNDLDDLTRAPSASTLAYLGPPFAPPQSPSPRLDLPLLKYIFRHFVLTFPFLAAAPDDFYSGKLQPFVDSLFARNLSSSLLLDDSDPQDPTPRKGIAKVERNLAMFITSAIKLDEPEDILRLSQADLQSLERAVDKRLARHNPRNSNFHVNIVSVRTVTEKGRVRSHVHEEFLIRTTLSHDRHVCVSRRYGDFRTLATELRKAHPDSIAPSPPPKDRTAVDAHVSPTPLSPTYPENPSLDSLAHEPSLPGDFYASQSTGGQSSSRLSREKNRLTLRAYLHTLLATPPFSSSPVLRSFFFSGPTTLSPQEQEDAQRREEADRVREQGRKEFAREIGARVDQLREAVRAVKGEIVGRDGLSNVFAIIKVTPYVKQLPDNYQAVLEWARISLASTIFQTFVASDNSSETFASLKRVHGLMPYFLLKAALKISSPMGMVRTVLDIFLAQPFGGRSLLQRMFTSSLTEEVRSLNTYIELVSAKIDSPVLCEKIRLFVHAPREIQETYRVDARLEHTHLLRAILMGSQEPVLPRSLAGRVDRAWRKWAAWMAERKRQGNGKVDEGDSDSEEGPTDEEAWLFEDLRVLFKLYSRLRDREQLIALIFEGVTVELLKDIITIFYAPLAQVYRAANIAESLGDLQGFINDLIRTVEETEDLSQSDPSSTVQAFIDLVNRHTQSFYSFVHKVHSKGQGLFDNLMKWIERFLTAIREGIGASDLGGEGNKITLETLLPAGGEERARIMEEVDKVMHWHYLNKIAHEERLRSRFQRAQRSAETDADAEDEATQVLINGIAGEFHFSDLVRANVDELAAEESEEDDDEDSDDYEDDEDGSDDDGTSDDDATESNEIEEDKSLQTHSVHSSTKTTQMVPSPGTSGLLRSQTTSSVAPRPRSMSLRSTKSMQTPSKRHPTVDAPPVPSLPVHLDKPLPPHPPGPSSAGLPRRRSIEHLASPELDPSGNPHPSSSSLPRHPRKPRKKAAATIQPPELRHIPTLLPIFVEMVC
ncbi:hypothetical protein JVT61DRAFT_12795 [Boletus reticuloceps]|uniref:PX domain-containing protein n=1 Tax=Boletus reticuloceps TaxID=495285 RepID=A0A8I3AAV2_9AGAM|nr:hypothetical protein JVT61DRAFT_12795 [Boletus reticuloceps]